LRTFAFLSLPLPSPSTVLFAIHCHNRCETLAQHLHSVCSHFSTARSTIRFAVRCPIDVKVDNNNDAAKTRPNAHSATLLTIRDAVHEARDRRAAVATQHAALPPRRAARYVVQRHVTPVAPDCNAQIAL
jgi:hypothetical protein